MGALANRPLFNKPNILTPSPGKFCQRQIALRQLTFNIFHALVIVANTLSRYGRTLKQTSHFADNLGFQGLTNNTAMLLLFTGTETSPSYWANEIYLD